MALIQQNLDADSYESSTSEEGDEEIVEAEETSKAGPSGTSLKVSKGEFIVNYCEQLCTVVHNYALYVQYCAQLCIASN